MGFVRPCMYEMVYRVMHVEIVTWDQFLERLPHSIESSIV